MAISFQLMNWQKRENGYLFFGAEETDTGGRATVAGEGEREGPEALTDTSPSQVAGYDGRSPGASVMGEQKLQPSSPQKIGIHAPVESNSSYLKRDTHAPKEQTTLNLHPVKFPKGNYLTGQAIF